MTRRFCSCGRAIFRGERGRMAGAGKARYWVVTFDPVWRHTDGTEACRNPGLTRLRKQAGHLGRYEDAAVLAGLLTFIVVLLHVTGVRV